ncbi:MAG: hypothetical protein ACTHK3_04580 [Solirubrobacterales bacterium]
MAVIAAAGLYLAVCAPASWAVSTTLCNRSADTPYCGPEYRFPAGTAFETSAANATIATGLGNVNCSESTLKGTIGAQSGEPLPVSIITWSLGGCSLKSTSCSVTPAATSPWPGEVAWTREEQGTLKVNKSGTGAPGWTVKCNPFISCTFAIEPTLDIKYEPEGGLNAIYASEESMSGKGVCPQSRSFSAIYKVTPTSVWLHPERAQTPPSTPALGLCRTTDFYCEASDLYGAGSTVNFESTNLSLHFAGTNPENGKAWGNLNCKNASVKAEPAESYGLGGSALAIAAANWSTEGCELPSQGRADCTLGIYQPEVSINAVELWQSQAGFWSSGNTQWLMRCGKNVGGEVERTEIMCPFEHSGGLGEQGIPLEGGAPGKFTFEGTSFLSLGGYGTECPSEKGGYATGTFTVNGPNGGALFLEDVTR